jgi:hypothetical protein
MDMPQRWWWWCITQILSYSSSYVDNWSLSLFVDQPSRAWFAPASPFGHIDNGGGNPYQSCLHIRWASMGSRLFAVKCHQKHLGFCYLLFFTREIPTREGLFFL